MLMVLVVVPAQYPHPHLVHSDCETGSRLTATHLSTYLRSGGPAYHVPLPVTGIDRPKIVDVDLSYRSNRLEYRFTCDPRYLSSLAVLDKAIGYFSGANNVCV